MDEQRYYIGVKSCDCLPEENTDYMGSSSTLTESISIVGKENFRKTILGEFDSRLEAEGHELEMHLECDAATNPEFYNKKNGVVGFHVTPEVTLKAQNARAITVNNPAWKQTVGLARVRKYRNTVNNESWRSSKGKEKADKISTFRTGNEGKKANKTHSETVNDPTWKATIGKQQTEKRLASMTKEAWQKKAKKRLETISDPTWRNKHTFICPHCEKSMVGIHNFNRWHGDKCKYKLDSGK